MSWLKTTGIAVVGALLLFLAVGCEKKGEGPAEQAGKELDKAGEHVGKAVQDMGKKMEDESKGESDK